MYYVLHQFYITFKARTKSSSLRSSFIHSIVRSAFKKRCIIYMHKKVDSFFFFFLILKALAAYWGGASVQGLRCHFISMPGKSPMKLEVTSRHDHSCLLGRKASKQTKSFYFMNIQNFLPFFISCLIAKIFLPLEAAKPY